MQLLDFRFLHRTVAMGNSHLLTIGQDPSMYTPHGYAARIAGIVKAGNQHLRSTLQLTGSGDDLNNLV